MESVTPKGVCAASRSSLTAEPSTSWASALSQAITRSYRSFVASSSSGQALGERVATVPRPAGGSPADAKDLKRTNETKSAHDAQHNAPVRHATLANVWPGHAFSSRPARSACEALVAQKGARRHKGSYHQ